ncbi:hypothetical protein Vadar_011991 [Vaccinium darrowii]|uniref:Uncharacterized protein n=1 Tax=Vaccinium darrowii TaxID=229202 RepID=A0ACB7X003_9ERIC|nr:hypothetical protein Vadar_011991 [Vaccinium darrowii]
MPTKRKTRVGNKQQKKIRTIDTPIDLGRFTTRAVTVERFVDTGKLAQITIPNMILGSNLESLMKQKGRANEHMVREFYHGIIRPYDSVNHKMQSVVRGVKMEFSADSIAQFLGVDRPNPYDERQYPFLPDVSLPDKLKIAKALGVKNAFNLEKARMLYKIIKKDPIDVGKIIWKVVEVASKIEQLQRYLMVYY